ncbi:hypothetical protein F2Q68_00015039 [Brassica cretica]|uniref:Replication protein A 70 kDa DNA-binding subunit B/D first OB fold domain-containing protein n=1 Tax=Brassica cretica TaxID=69181 RepID=A0A8S9HA33_BRACR|nr:hypothetical protein F2Q68_00015039 [Brassica cretica]
MRFAAVGVFSDLKTGNCSSVVEARLLRYWETNVKRGGELMWVDMLSVDVNATMMQATISAHRLPWFKERLIVGAMFSIADFDVARCAQNFRLSDSSLMIRFNVSTSFDEIDEPVPALPEETFWFRDQSELLGLANTNTQLPDIIGEILGVKSTVTDPPEEKNRVMVTIEMDSDDTITLSLFDSQSVAFHKQLEAMRVDPKVIVATSINPKMVGGRLFLNATSGKHVYFDKKTNAWEVRFYPLVARDTGLPSVAPLLRSYAKVEKMTIVELNSFIVSAGSQRTMSAFPCGRCNNLYAVGALRYRVEMAIADDTAEGTFVWFDGVMTKFHSLRAREAVQMLAEDGVNPKDSRVPPFIANMEGQSYSFQVRVTALNFTEHHKMLTITRIAEELGRVPVDDMDDNRGDDEDEDDIPPGKPAPEEFGSGGAIGESSSSADTGTVRNARTKVVKKARVG